MHLSSHEQPETARYLLIDADQSGAAVLMRALGSGPVPTAVLAAKCGRQGAAALRAQRFDVVLMDLASLTDLAAPPEEAVTKLVKLAEGALTIALSDGRSVSAAVEVMRAGAHDCIARPVTAQALAGRIAELALRHGKGRVSGMAGERRRELAEPRTPSRSAAMPPILPMWQQEQRIIEDAIANFSGNIALAAAALQLSPSTIYRKRQAWAEMEGKRGAA